MLNDFLMLFSLELHFVSIGFCTLSLLYYLFTIITIRLEGLGPITNTVAHTVVPELEVVTNPSSNKGVREEDEPGTNI